MLEISMGTNCGHQGSLKKMDGHHWLTKKDITILYQSKISLIQVTAMIKG